MNPIFTEHSHNKVHHPDAKAIADSGDNTLTSTHSKSLQQLLEPAYDDPHVRRGSIQTSPPKKTVKKMSQKAVSIPMGEYYANHIKSMKYDGPVSLVTPMGCKFFFCHCSNAGPNGYWIYSNRCQKEAKCGNLICTQIPLGSHGASFAKIRSLVDLLVDDGFVLETHKKTKKAKMDQTDLPPAKRQKSCKDE